MRLIGWTVAGIVLAAMVSLIWAPAPNAHAGLINPYEDADMDGCTTAEELGPDPTLGGLRDPNNPWDFYDTNLDGTIDLLNDILGVIQAYGQGPGDPNYTVMKDRGPGLGPPDGYIDLLNDVLGVIQQYGHSCTARQWCDGDVKDGVLLSTEPFEAEVGSFWQDCFTLYNDEGLVIDYVIRDASVDYSMELMTTEELNAIGITIPESALNFPEWAGVAGLPSEWEVHSCSGDILYRNRHGHELTKLEVFQIYVTTQYTNIVWPPPNGFAFASASLLWSVGNDPEPRPEPYPVYYYDIPNNIVAVGETFATARFELNIGAFGFSVTLFSATDHLYLEFGHNFCRETRSPGFGY